MSTKPHRDGFEPFARFPLSRLGPEWFGPNWLTTTDWFGHQDHLFPLRWPATLPPGPAGMPLRIEEYIEEYDEGDTHVIRAELPGLDPETDITVEVDRDVLTVSATREHRETGPGDEGRGRMIHTEFSYGTFRRHIRLPAGSGPDDVTATYDAGVLEIRIARHQPAAPAVAIKVTGRDPAPSSSPDETAR